MNQAKGSDFEINFDKRMELQSAEKYKDMIGRFYKFLPTCESIYSLKRSARNSGPHWPWMRGLFRH